MVGILSGLGVVSGTWACLVFGFSGLSVVLLRVLGRWGGFFACVRYLGFGCLSLGGALWWFGLDLGLLLRCWAGGVGGSVILWIWDFELGLVGTCVVVCVSVEGFALCCLWFGFYLWYACFCLGFLFTVFGLMLAVDFGGYFVVWD